MCGIPACQITKRRHDAPNGSKEAAVVNGRCKEKDVGLTEAAADVLEIVTDETEGKGAGVSVGCCSGGGDDCDGGSCGGCGGD